MKLENEHESSAAWEEICNRCGRCCYEKYDYRGKIFYSKKPCQYLDLKTNECKVYLERSQYQPECARLTPELVKAGILPVDCPYVTKFFGELPD